uniref:RING-CH-type domain-containing protein n=1 Tax=Noccaea caerulescens TaxID=107243 RepID=A0A1J3G5U5_NOCCA
MEPVQPHLDTFVSVRGGKVLITDNNIEPRRSSVGDTATASSTVKQEDEIVKDEERRSNASLCSVEVDLELGMPEKAVHLSQPPDKDCRICHMSLDAANLESGVPIELGCSCKDDLAAAHKHCAETWFKIKGNKICEVCGSIAGNVVGVIETESEESQNEANGRVNQALRTSAPRGLAEARSFWQGHRFLNFLLACMVFAFVISWLFHFNVTST